MAKSSISVVQSPLSSLKIDPSNARKHDKKNLAAIQASLTRFGQVEPLVVQKSTRIVIGGNGRLEAMKALGWKEAAIVEVDVDATQAAALGIALNRTAELAAWDEETLAKLLHGLREDGFDLEEIGFDIDDLDDIGMGGNGKINEDNQDNVPEVKESFVNRGEIWTLGNHRLMCGDSTSKEDVARLMAGEKADMVFTDPPYGVSYEKKCGEIANQSKSRITSKIQDDDLGVDGLKVVIQAAFHNINSVLAEKSCYYICSPQGGELGLMMMMMMMMMMQEACIPCRHMIIWVKNAPVFSMGRLDYDYQHEPILYGWSPKRTHFKSTQEGQWKSSTWTCNREPNKLHPTMKPVELMVNAITNSCPGRGRVLDLFLGSGSTLIAAEKTGRRCFGMEIDEHYCSVIIKRWQDLTGKEAKKVG